LNLRGRPKRTTRFREGNVYAHKPVLLEPVLSFLLPIRLPVPVPAGGREICFVDATVGEGGHTEVGVDRDGEILRRAEERLERFGRRVRLFHMGFSEFFRRYGELVDIRPGSILFDLGISMYHYESSGRGFSLQREEPLDMRLDPSRGPTAGELIETLEEEELADLLFRYGEERLARRISKAIVRERVRGAIPNAKALAEVVSRAVPASYRYGRIHPATRTFQALRIAVNEELAALEEALPEAFETLAVGGRMAVISFHSLEDRIVKRFFQERNKSCTCPPDAPICQCGGLRRGRLLTRKPVVADEQEMQRNPASRSAKLRVLEKIA
jgi:16S rRNA (cytosine1402-N4)-methyltransferase